MVACYVELHRRKQAAPDTETTGPNEVPEEETAKTGGSVKEEADVSQMTGRELKAYKRKQKTES